MLLPRLGSLELRIMEILWSRGASSVREILESFPAKGRPAFTTVQTTVYRLEGKKALRCAKRIGKANIFEPSISRESVEGGLIDDLLLLLGGKTQRVMSHLVRAGKLSMDDIKEARQELRRLSKEKQS
jgi:BlaI family penicillinase repressor